MRGGSCSSGNGSGGTVDGERGRGVGAPAVPVPERGRAGHPGHPRDQVELHEVPRQPHRRRRHPVRHGDPTEPPRIGDPVVAGCGRRGVTYSVMTSPLAFVTMPASLLPIDRARLRAARPVADPRRTQPKSSARGRPSVNGRTRPRRSVTLVFGSMPSARYIVAVRSAGDVGRSVGYAPILSLAP